MDGRCPSKTLLELSARAYMLGPAFILSLPGGKARTASCSTAFIGVQVNVHRRVRRIVQKIDGLAMRGRGFGVV